MGTYPIPGARYFALDVDGTKGYYVPDATASSNPIAVMPQADLTTITDFSIITALGQNSNDLIYEYVFLFPEPRNISAFSISIDHQWGPGSGWLGYFKYSTNSITGFDGTWTDIASKATLDQYYNATAAKLRQPTVVSFSSVRAVKVVAESSSNWWYRLKNLNLWGAYTPAGLEFRDSATDTPMYGSNFDFGDTLQGAIYTKTFRVKNNHTLTANNVTVESPLTPLVGQIRTDLEFSINASPFAANIVIPTMAPGALSSVITVRRSVAANATTNNFGTARISATPQSWS